ncbi:MAG: hypothetical protein ABIO57_02220 [Candidatus Paceibacterota bacterium]
MKNKKEKQPYTELDYKMVVGILSKLSTAVNNGTKDHGYELLLNTCDNPKSSTIKDFVLNKKTDILKDDDAFQIQLVKFNDVDLVEARFRTVSNDYTLLNFEMGLKKSYCALDSSPKRDLYRNAFMDIDDLMFYKKSWKKSLSVFVTVIDLAINSGIQF